MELIGRDKDLAIVREHLRAGKTSTLKTAYESLPEQLRLLCCPLAKTSCTHLCLTVSSG